MNLLYINPPFKGRFSRASRSPAIAKGGTLYYPVWLAQAAATAKAQGHIVKFFDAPAQGLSIEDIFSSLNSYPPDITVFDTSTGSLYSDLDVVKQFKLRYPTVTTIVVGTHPTARPEEILKVSPDVDIVARREYDYTIPEISETLANGKKLENVKGITFRRKGQIVSTEDRTPIEDLDSLPFGSFIYNEFLNYRDYFFAAANYPIVQIMTGRGCPFKCTWCVYPQVFHGHKYRVRSAENVVSEFEYIIKHFPDVKEIGIEDDCFTANRGRVREICQLIIDRNIKIKWYANVRGDVPYDLLLTMKKAGCRLVTVGFESNDQQVLDAMKKGARVSKYYQFAKDARKAGLLVHGCIMIGNPGDTPEKLEEYYRFAKEIDCDSMQFYPVYLYPGTEAYETAYAKGMIRTQNYAQWLTPEGLHNCTFDTPGMTSEQMLALCDYYLTRYHLRPTYILRKILQGLKFPSEGIRTLRSAQVFFGKLFRGHLNLHKRKIYLQS